MEITLPEGFTDWLNDNETTKGGKGSGNFSHSGRPGKVGGSAPMSRSFQREEYEPIKEPKLDAQGNEIVEVPEEAYAGSLFDLEPYTRYTLGWNDAHPLVSYAHALAGTDPVSGLTVTLDEQHTVVDEQFYEEGNRDDMEPGSFNPEESSLAASYEVMDKDGRRVGTIEVSMSHWDVNLDLLSLYSGYQDSGFGTRWVENFEAASFDELGASMIYLHANLDVGGYYWARLGYDCSDSGTFEYLKRRLAEEWRSQTGKRIDRDDLDELEHTWEIAMTSSGRKRIGKDALLRSDWHGYKESYGEGRDVGEEYFAAYRNGKKRKKKRLR